MGQLTEVLAIDEETLAIFRDLARDKSNAEAQHDMALMLERIGIAKLKGGDRLGAQSAFDEGLGTFSELARSKEPEQIKNLWASVGRIAQAKLQAGDRRAAIKVYEEHLPIFRHFAEDKANSEAKHDLVVLLLEIGDAKSVAGDTAGALRAYVERVEAARLEFAANHEDNPTAREDLVDSLVSLGKMKENLGDPSGALVIFEETLALSRALAKNKSDIWAQRILENSLASVGHAKVLTGDKAGALAAYEEGVTNAREFVSDKGEDKTDDGRRYLAAILSDYGQVAPDPSPVYTEALAILEELRREGVLEGGGYAHITWIVAKLAEIKRHADSSATTLADYEKNVALAHERAKDKGNAQAQRDLIDTIHTVADVKLQSGDHAGALGASEESLSVSREFAKDKGNVVAQAYLVSDVTRVGNVKRSMGDLSGAFTAYKESLKLARELIANNVGDANAYILQKYVADQMATLSHDFLFTREFEQSLDASDQALAAVPNLLISQINRAHALTFLCRIDDARTLYLAHRGEIVRDGKIWESVVKTDFADLRKTGLEHPLHDEIETLFDRR